jgi:hypothetical protein
LSPLCLSSPYYTLCVTLLLISTVLLDTTLNGAPQLVAPGLRFTVAPRGVAPFSLQLDASNSAYQLVIVGPETRQLLAVTAALQLRSVDAERDILLLVGAPLTGPLMEALEQLRVTVTQVPFERMRQMENDFGPCCEQYWGCWMKLLTWRAPARYRAVMNIDTDFLAVGNLSRAFSIFADDARGPFDVGGVPDPVVAASHDDPTTHDVFNGGMFIAQPSEEAFERVVRVAHATRCRWGEMLWLNTFASTVGRWVRLPNNFNLFPSLLGPTSPYLAYAPPNWRSIAGLHFAGVSKVWPDATAKNCLERAELDCLECCLRWVRATKRLRALLAANTALAGGGAAAAAAERVLAGALPPGWGGAAAAIVRRNAARGFTFDAEAFHDGETGSTFGARKTQQALEFAAATQEQQDRWKEMLRSVDGASKRAFQNANAIMQQQKAVRDEALKQLIAETREQIANGELI